MAKLTHPEAPHSLALVDYCAQKLTKSLGVRATLPGWTVATASTIKACTSSFSLPSASGGAVNASEAAGWFVVAFHLNMLPSTASDVTTQFFTPVLNSLLMPVTLQT